MITVNLSHDEVMSYLAKCPGECRYRPSVIDGPFRLEYPESLLWADLFWHGSEPLLHWKLSGPNPVDQGKSIIPDNWLNK